MKTNFLSRFFAFLFFASLSFNLQAAITNYSFAASNGTYTAISGTVLFASSTTARWDDGESAMQTIPFTFNYNGTNYTNLFVNANGYITLGTTTGTTSNYCGLQASAGNTIAGYGTDLVGGSLATTADIEVTTRGTAPNRQYVVQWNDCAHWTSGTYTDHWSFQIILNETTNTVQVVWGNSTNSSVMGANTCADSPLESGSVGLIGSSNTDFNIRSVTNGTNTWATSTAGTTISAVCNMNASNIPANGLTYTWTPAPATNMSYVSSTTTFLSNGMGVARGATNSGIIQLQVNTTGTLSPLTITNINFATTGCANAANDISGIKVFYTGTSPNFATTTQFGSTLTTTGSLSFTGTATLSEGTNYFWLTYNISNSATIGDALKACCNSFSGSGISSTTPSTTCPTGTQSVYQAGTWTAVTTNCPAPSMGHMMLLSDGTVLCKTNAGGSDGYGNQFYKLTPNASGSYVGGTWSAIAPMIDTRLWYSSQVLKDGRLYVAGGEYGTGLNNAEVYNPLTNTWTIAGSPGRVSDANSAILEDGRVLQALVSGALTATQIYDPTTNTYVAGPTARGIHNESSWLKLPDNSILFVDRLTTNSERYIPATNTWIADGTIPVQLYDPYGDETGAAFLLPDGRGFFIGAWGHTAYYTPSGTTAAGTWTAGPDIPNGNAAPDAGAAMMVNGKIICAVSPLPTSANHFPSPTTFYEFDYTTNTFTLISTPSGAASISSASYTSIFLDLPNGQVLYSQLGTSKYYVYTPAGSQLSAGTPTINANSIKQLSCDSFAISGNLFNGISEGACYGDDAQMNTNFPVIRLTNGSNVYYARTNNWNSTGVMRGTANDTTYFKLPSGLAAGTYNLVVTSNGFASAPLSFNTQATLTSSLTPNAVCSGVAFNYTPTSNRTNATYSWTRAAVAGISNAAETTAQNGNISETLVNTTSNPITVVYVVTITTGSCSNTQNVSVVVNPTSSSTTNITACNSYTWNGTTYNTSGTYTYTTTNSKGCDSTATLILTINSATSSTTNITACNNYTWNGTTYNTSGTYTKTDLVNSKGCDSVATLVLTISTTASSHEYLTLCKEYTWNGTTYGVTGVYSYQTTSATGCDSIAYLHLTVNEPTYSTTYINSCGSYTWNGTTYTTSGTYGYITVNVKGCDSSASLILNIYSPTSSTTSIAACNSYTWNGTTYNTSGTYTKTGLVNSKGCDSTAILNLTIKQSTSSTTTINTNSSYTWNGTTYNTSGTYTKTFTNAAGCDSIATLNLTINTITCLSISASQNSVCVGGQIQYAANIVGGTWSVLSRGTIDATTGLFTATYAGTSIVTYTLPSIPQGCSSKTATLNLTVNALPNIPSLAYAPGTSSPQTTSVGGVIQMCTNKTFTLIGSPANGVWSKIGNFNASPLGIASTNVNVNTAGASGMGSITYTVTNSNGCSNSRTMSANFVSCGAKGLPSTANSPLSAVSSPLWTIYPNPAKNVVNIAMEKLVGDGQIIVTNMLGKQVFAQALSMGNSTIDISNLAKGVYFVSVITNEAKQTKKLVVE